MDNVFYCFGHHMKQQLFLILLFIISAWSCSSQKEIELPEEFQELKNLIVHSGDTQPTLEIRFEREQSFSSTNEVLIGDMSAAPAVDDRGRVFIADRIQNTIHVFSPDGCHLTKLGREGRGPGEYGNIRSLHIRNDRLYVYDPGQYKIDIFTLDTLEIEKAISLAGNRGEYQSLNNTYPWIHKIFVRNNGTYFAQFIAHSSTPNKKWQNVDMKGFLYPLDSAGKITSRILIEFKEEICTYIYGLLSRKPFFENARTVLSSDDTIYLAGPAYFLIKEYSPEGDYRQAFYYPVKKIPLTQESAVEAGAHDYYIQNMELMDLPPTWPVLTEMIIDDQDRLWIATTVEDMNIFEWWVLEKTGELITRFKWPRDGAIQVVRGDYIYTRDTDPDTDIQQIVRYRIALEEI
ncbi:MAG: 6-bladed beta-propeller [Balneolaceae bacterium]